MKMIAFAATIVAMLWVPVVANIVVVSQTLDLTQPKNQSGPGFQGWQDAPGFNLGFNVDIAEGDTFDFTIDFLGTQTLTLTNATQIWAYSYADVGGEVTATGTLSLLDATGAPFLTSNPLTDTEGDVHLGQFFDGSNFAGGLPASLTFSGLRYVGKVDDYVVAGQTTKRYNNPALYVTADEVIIDGVAPEPATAPMILAACGFAVSLVRTRRVLTVDRT